MEMTPTFDQERSSPMSSNAHLNRTTPGVYISEHGAFAPSIVGVATAIPIFIGYTATAADPSSGKNMYLQAVPLSSMAGYMACFGGAFDAKGAVMAAANTMHDFQALSSTVKGDGKTLASATHPYLVGTSFTSGTITTQLPAFNLHAAMQLFFANGGGECYVISVASYWGDNSITAPAGAQATAIRSSDLLAGLKVAQAVTGGTMLVIPDACLLAPQTEAAGATGYGDVACAMLRQAATLQDRVAILDLPGALDPACWSPEGMSSQATNFSHAIAPAADSFSYGACYGPALVSSLPDSSDIDYGMLAGTPASQTLMNHLLTSQALSLYPVASDGGWAPAFVAIAAHIAAAFPATGTVTAFGLSAGVTGSVASAGQPSEQLLVSLAAHAICPAPDDSNGRHALDQYLRKATPLLAQVLPVLADRLNTVPPSGALAGVWARNDSERGVWNAPANLGLQQITAPVVLLTDAQQASFNAPLNGNAINILRAIPGRGTVVWGARTLDGNSLDYRYIQVRRTLNYIEQSIKAALRQFVFAPNEGGTWATVTASISNFLTQLWQAGGLMGDKASDAFTVACGVPTTMSGLDVLDGYLIANVTVQLIHPAEFIELTFKQNMQGT